MAPSSFFSIADSIVILIEINLEHRHLYSYNIHVRMRQSALAAHLRRKKATWHNLKLSKLANFYINHAFHAAAQKTELIRFGQGGGEQIASRHILPMRWLDGRSPRLAQIRVERRNAHCVCVCVCDGTLLPARPC